METKEEWNKQVDHPLQSFEWGEFRKLSGVGVVQQSGMQITIHSIPHTPWNVGYCPKGEVNGEFVCIPLKMLLQGIEPDPKRIVELGTCGMSSLCS